MPADKDMRILVVDDMSTMRKIISKTLKNMGFTNIEEADDGATAWPMVEKSIEFKQPYHFIISDWNMPKMTGIDFLKKVRETSEYKKLPFLMVTAEAEQKNVITAVQAGVSNYIVKPFTPDSLAEKIKKLFP